jgi:hypothetical protein
MRISRLTRWLPYLLLAVTFTVLYTQTLQHAVQAADSGELQLVAATFGVAHPPGYPFWSMLAGGFARLPGISPLTGVSLFSAMTAVATLLVVARTVEMVLVYGQCAPRAALLSGVAAASALGVASTFWAQAIGANIRSLTALFAALLAWCAARSYVGRTSIEVLALVLGLGVAHHPSLVFSGIVVAACVLLRDRGASFIGRVIRLVLIAAAAQIVWLYLPLRDVAGAAFAPGSLRTWTGFLDHALARGFGGDMFWFVLVEPQRLLDRLALLPSLTAFLFGDWIAWAILLAAVAALIHAREFAAVLIGAVALHLFVTLTYRAPQTVEYALPAWVLMTVLLGVGVGSVPHRMRLVAASMLLCAAAVLGFLRWSSFDVIARDSSVRDSAAAVLDAAAPDGVVLAQWHQATALWAVQHFERHGDGVRVEYVAPQGAQPYAETFAARAAALSTNRVFVTSFFAPEFQRIGLHAAPVDKVPAWRVSSDSSHGALDAAAVRFDERIVIRVLHIPQTPDAPLRGHPGALLPIDVAWRLEGAAQAGDALSVRFMRRDGRLAAAADVALTDVGTSGSVRRRLALPLDIEPGVYDLLVGAYRVADGGFVSYADSTGRPFVVVGRLEVVAAAQPPATQRAQPDLCAWRCDAPALIGVDYDLGLPGRVRLWTHWRAGASDVQVAILDSSGQAIAAPRTLAAARGYLSLAFDVPPARSLQVRFGERTMPLPDFRAGERYVPFGDRMALVGLSSHLRGAERLVDLDWLSARPIFDDFIVSVRIAGAAHDGVPALGALPTLKWLRGSRVFDRHPLIAAVSASNPGSVVVYDSLSREELPVLDERYQGTFSFTISEP